MDTPSEKWTWSDKLALALTCGGAAMALILFWIAKTPLACGLSLMCIVGLLAYPIIHFVPPKVRVPSFIVMISLVGIFGWNVWPQRSQPHSVSPSSEIATTAPIPSQPKTAQSPKPSTDRPPAVHKPIVPPSYIDQHKAEWAKPIPQNLAPTVNVQPGAAVSFGQRGGITAGQVVIAEESIIPITLSYSQEQITPPHPDALPYALRVTVRTNRRVEPSTLALFFDGPVEVPHLPFSCMSCGNGRLNDANGTADLNTVWVFWGSPPLIPDRPAVFTVESLHPVKLLRISRGPESGL